MIAIAQRYTKLPMVQRLVFLHGFLWMTITTTTDVVQAFSPPVSHSRTQQKRPSDTRLSFFPPSSDRSSNLDDALFLSRALSRTRVLHRKRSFLSLYTHSTRSRQSNRLIRRLAKKDDTSKSDDDETNQNISSGVLSDMKHKWDASFSAVQDTLPEPVSAALTTIYSTWQAVKWYLITLVAGTALGLGLLIVPLYSAATSLSQPVTLFETILADLEQAYVDPVDTNKLFETGINAMLQSLDPYTEFEGAQEAAYMTESIEGRYGGVGLVIAGIPASAVDKVQILPETAKEDTAKLNNDAGATPEADDATSPVSSSTTNLIFDETALEKVNGANKATTKEALARQKLLDRGVRVVTAFEGYAFDYGMRVGDKLVAVDALPIQAGTTTVEQVRNTLRGEPGTLVTIQFERDGVDGVQSVTMPRAVVKLRDVKLATLLGRPSDGMGYIQLSGFSQDAGRQVRSAILALQRATEDATGGERTLQGLVLDLRGNPGGLLTSAVDVSSLLVPKGSDIVSAKGRGFPGIKYRSRVEPILDTKQTKLAVLVNGSTASAAEIVSGAVQDLDVGVIVGSDRTFGKGLVQNVEELPYNTALKFTVAKYYTPSGRCIQGINYSEGDKNTEDGKYVASKVDEKDRGTFYTRLGRVVRDGGGVEADYKVPSTKASALEVTLLRSGLFADFASDWSKKHELTNNFSVDEDTYKSFQVFVQDKQKSGDVQLEAIYGKPLEDLKKALQASEYKGSEKSLEQLQARIVRDIQQDFDKFRSEIKEDIAQNILARYLPESMLIERSIEKDPQVDAAVKLLASRTKFDSLLAKGGTADNTLMPTTSGSGSSLNVAAGTNIYDKDAKGFRSTIKW